MKTLVCPYCGCSLVRLGISEEKAATYSHDGTEYHFCCQGCVDLFVIDPDQHLQRTKDLVVCPTCLAEKPPESAFTFEYAGQEVHYCGCRKCANLSWKLKRLQTLWFDGVGRNNIKPVRERSRDEESVTFGEKTQEEASTG